MHQPARIEKFSQTESGKLHCTALLQFSAHPVHGRDRVSGCLCERSLTSPPAEGFPDLSTGAQDNPQRVRRRVSTAIICRPLSVFRVSSVSAWSFARSTALTLTTTQTQSWADITRPVQFQRYVLLSLFVSLHIIGHELPPFCSTRSLSRPIRKRSVRIKLVIARFGCAVFLHALMTFGRLPSSANPLQHVD